MTFAMTGCFKNWDYKEVQTWYDEKPTNFEEYMAASRHMLQSNRSDRAKYYLTEAMNSIDSQYGPDDLRIATAADDLGAIQEQEGNLKEAEATYRRAFDARKNSLPKNSPDLIRTQKKLAEVLTKQFKEEEAKKVMNELSDKKIDSKIQKSTTNNSSHPKSKRRKRHIDPE